MRGRAGPEVPRGAATSVPAGELGLAEAGHVTSILTSDWSRAAPPPTCAAAATPSATRAASPAAPPAPAPTTSPRTPPSPGTLAPDSILGLMEETVALTPATWAAVASTQD